MKNGQSVETPLLLPSFSSKGFHIEDVESILKYMEQIITDEILISSYDLWHGNIKKIITFPSVIFLDSGGYEASEDVELSDTGKRGHKARKWTMAQHKRVLSKWKFDRPTVIISFDSPKAKTAIANQIKRSSVLFGKYPTGNSEILFKTQSIKERFVNIGEIIENVHGLSGFDIIGFTEKELGESTLERMTRIAEVRLGLKRAGLDKPIHIFGSLDTVSTPLYFFSGADIFDGLTWLRYAYDNGQTLYKHNYGAQKLGINFADFSVNGKVWNDNYYYLTRMKNDMHRFLVEKDFSEFAFNSEFFREAVTQFRGEMKKKGLV